MKIKHLLTFSIVLASFLSACKKDKSSSVELSSVLIVNEGNFGSSTAELSTYNPENHSVSNNIFSTVNNGAELGDVAQSAFQIGNELFIAVNNSRKIEVLDAFTFVRKRVLILPDGNYPRFMTEGNSGELIVTNLFNPNVLRVNTQSGDITGTINVGYDSQGLARLGDKIYIALPGSWPDYHNEVAVLSLNDYSVTHITVSVNPTRVIADEANQKIYVLSAGTYGGNNAGLHLIDASNNTIVKSVSISGSPSDMSYNKADKRLYISNAGFVQALNSENLSVVSESLFQGNYSAIAFSSLDKNIYVTDPLDYVQDGLLWVYNTSGSKISPDTLRVSVAPSYIYFIEK